MARKRKAAIPYEHASSGVAARDEITKILCRFGCESVGFMDDFADKAVILAFKHRGRPVQLRASAKGWAALWLKENPWSSYRGRTGKQQYEQAAYDQGLVATNSILRDWVKGQVTAIETGILSFEAVFFPYMLTSDGKPVIDALASTGLLPAPKE